MSRLLILSLCVAVLVGCGGTARSPHSSSTPPTGSTGSGGGVTPANPPNVVSVAAGAAAPAIDVAVSSPASATPPNAQDLGVAGLTGGASAFNTGAVIHRGSSMRIVLFGPGLTADMQVTIRGPADIKIADVTGIKATDNTPGISFTAAVAADAALGSRTVVLQNAQGDITTFTGGLEVVP